MDFYCFYRVKIIFLAPKCQIRLFSWFSCQSDKTICLWIEANHKFILFEYLHALNSRGWPILSTENDRQWSCFPSFTLKTLQVLSEDALNTKSLAELKTTPFILSKWGPICFSRITPLMLLLTYLTFHSLKIPSLPPVAIYTPEGDILACFYSLFWFLYLACSGSWDSFSVTIFTSLVKAPSFPNS